MARILVVLAIVGVGVFFVVNRLRPEVEVAEVRLGKAADAVPGSVTVFADRGLQELKVEAAGKVVECARLDPGTRFTKDEILLRLDDSDIVREMKDAKRAYHEGVQLAEIQDGRKADLAQAEQNLATQKRLLELGRVSTEDVNRAQRAVEQIVTAIKVAGFNAEKNKDALDRKLEADERQLKKMVVRAPADGMVAGATVYVGMVVSSGTTVATFYVNERVVIAKIGEEDIAKVKVGHPARVQLLKYPGEDFDAKVIKILPFADPETHRYNVYLKVEADLDKLEPNSTGEAVITVGTHDQVPLVPRLAIFNGSQGPAVYVVQGGRLVERAVEVGFRGVNQAEVSKGLQPGDRVVIVEDLDRYHDGQRVSPKLVSW